MTRLVTAAFLVAGCIIPQKPAFSQEATEDEFNATITKSADSILLQWHSIEKRVPVLGTEPLAFDFAIPVREEHLPRTIRTRLEWKPMRKLPAVIDLQEPEFRTRVNSSIDAGMLLDGYQRNLRSLR